MCSGTAGWLLLSNNTEQVDVVEALRTLVGAKRAGRSTCHPSGERRIRPGPCCCLWGQQSQSRPCPHHHRHPASRPWACLKQENQYEYNTQSFALPGTTPHSWERSPAVGPVLLGISGEAGPQEWKSSSLQHGGPCSKDRTMKDTYMACSLLKLPEVALLPVLPDLISEGTGLGACRRRSAQHQ